jgi:hypothetical protein
MRKSTDIRLGEVRIQSKKNNVRTRFARYKTFLDEPSLRALILRIVLGIIVLSTLDMGCTVGTVIVRLSGVVSLKCLRMRYTNAKLKRRTPLLCFLRFPSPYCSSCRGCKFPFPPASIQESFPWSHSRLYAIVTEQETSQTRFNNHHHKPAMAGHGLSIAMVQFF